MKSFFYNQINEELLIEKKLQDVYKNKLKDTINGDLLYKQIVAADPTAQGLEGQESGDYINWIGRIVIRDYLEKHKQVPVLSATGENLKRFERYKQWWRRNKAQVQKEEEAQNAIQRQINPDLPIKPLPSFDINTYKTFMELAMSLEKIYDVIKHYGYDETSKEMKKEAEAIKKDTKHSHVMYEDHDFAFVDTLSHKSNCAWGINTKWCTTSKDDYMFEHYRNLDGLYILLDKKNNARYQFHFPTGQYMDELDQDIPPQKLKEIFKRIPETLREVIIKVAVAGSRALDNIQMVFDDVENEASDLENEKQELGNQIEDLENEIKELQDKHEKLKDEYEEMDEDDKDESNIDAEISDLEAEIKEKKSKLDNVQRDFDKIDDRITDLRDGEFEYEGRMYDPNEIDFGKHRLKQFLKALNASPQEEIKVMNTWET